MGCTSSRCQLNVTYGSATKSTNQYLSYKSLRSWISSQFPELYQNPYRLQTITEPVKTIKNNKDFLSLYNNLDELKLIVLLENSKRYKPEIFRRLSKSIFKVRKNKDDIEAIGFMVSPRMCLVGIKENVFEYHALFEDGSSLNFKQGGIHIALEKFSLVELDITSSWASKNIENKSILLVTSEHEQGVVLFYSKSTPILQEYIGKSLESTQTSVCFDKKPLNYCTIGAPVFNDAGSVYAVYTEDGRARKLSTIVEELESKAKYLSPLWREAVEEIFVLNRFKFKGPGKNRLGKISALIDYETSSLIYSKNSKSHASPKLEAIKGSSCAVTPYGVAVSGSDGSDSKVKAWLFDGKSIKNLPNMIEKHLNHSSIYWNNKVFVFSGKYTSVIEYYDFLFSTWKVYTKLPARISFTSVIQHDKSTFLFGGLKSHKRISRSIFKIEDHAYAKLKIKLPLKLLSACISLVSSNEILIFGGKSDLDQYNNGVWKLNLTDGDIETLEGQGKNLTFETYPVTINGSKYTEI